MRQGSGYATMIAGITGGVGMQIEEVKKEEVEELLRCRISDGQFEKALKYARDKQGYIYQRDKRPVVLQHWYLVKLTEEYVRNLAFSEYTMDLCEKLRNVEKERPEKEKGAQMDNHIVAGRA